MEYQKVDFHRCTCDEMSEDDLHSCPYAEDINGDSEAFCACCPYCEYQCAMDI